METWKLKELKDAVLENHGEAYSSKIQEPLQSFHVKSMMAFYHAEEYQTILEEMLEATEYIKEPLTELNATIMAIFHAASVGEKGDKIMLAKFKAEAHLIAAAQSLHSLFDIIASIIYYVLKLDSFQNSPRENKINLHSVSKCLKENNIHSKTNKIISRIISSPEFAYLSAYVNTTKHRSLIPASLSASLLQNKSGILLNEFTFMDYKGNKIKFEKKWSQDFILDDFQKLRGELLSLGNTLNSYFKNE